MNLKMTKLKTTLVLRQRCEYSVCLSLGILVLGEERCAVEWTLDFSSVWDANRKTVLVCLLKCDKWSKEGSELYEFLSSDKLGLGGRAAGLVPKHWGQLEERSRLSRSCSWTWKVKAGCVARIKWFLSVQPNCVRNCQGEHISCSVFSISAVLDAFQLSRIHVNNFVELRSMIWLNMMCVRETASQNWHFNCCVLSGLPLLQYFITSFIVFHFPPEKVFMV